MSWQPPPGSFPPAAAYGYGMPMPMQQQQQMYLQQQHMYMQQQQALQQQQAATQHFQAQQQMVSQHSQHQYPAGMVGLAAPAMRPPLAPPVMPPGLAPPGLAQPTISKAPVPMLPGVVSPVLQPPLPPVIPPNTAVAGIPYGMMALPNEGVKTVVFVKGIPSEADNNLMSSVLSRCGKLLSLKRGEDTTTGVLKDFAFAEYENADSALRALRLLNNMEMGASKLSLKCDTKTQSALQEHHRIKIQKATGVVSSAPVLNGASLPPKNESANAPVDIMVPTSREQQAEEVLKNQIHTFVLQWTIMHGGGSKSTQDIEQLKEDAVLHRVKDQMQEYASNEGIELEDDEEARRLKIVSEGLKKFKEDSRQKEEERRKFFEQRLAKLDQAKLDQEKPRDVTAGAVPPPPPGPVPPPDRRDRERSRSAERRRDRERDSRDRDRDYRDRRRDGGRDDRDRDRRDRENRSQDHVSSETAVLPAPTPAAPISISLNISKQPKGASAVASVGPSVLGLEDDLQARPSITLTPLVLTEEEREQAAILETQNLLAAARTATSDDQRCKRLIDKIPTDKTRLFNFSFSWKAFDEGRVLENKLLPWIKKKVKELVGAEEPVMIKFLVDGLAQHRDATYFETQLSPILDAEAEAFVKLMWRMLVFETLRQQL